MPTAALRSASGPSGNTEPVNRGVVPSFGARRRHEPDVQDRVRDHQADGRSASLRERFRKSCPLLTDALEGQEIRCGAVRRLMHGTIGEIRRWKAAAAGLESLCRPCSVNALLSSPVKAWLSCNTRGVKRAFGGDCGVIVVDRGAGIRNGDCAAGRSRSLFFVFASERFGDAGERPGISGFAG